MEMFYDLLHPKISSYNIEVIGTHENHHYA